MKKSILCTILSFLFLLTAGCSPVPVKQGRSLTLVGVSVDGEVLDVSSVYPSGGSLTVFDDGTGELTLDGKSCDVTWSALSEGYQFTINSMEAVSSTIDPPLSLMLSELGLELDFDASGAGFPEASSEEEDSDSWHGRIYFSDCEGIWAEYDGRSMALSGGFSQKEDGCGNVSLFNASYSEEIPMISIDYQKEEDRMSCLSGFVMSYPLNAGDARFLVSSGVASDLDKDAFVIEHEYEPWLIFDEPEEEAVVSMISIRGSAKNDSGGFDYEILLLQ